MDLKWVPIPVQYAKKEQPKKEEAFEKPSNSSRASNESGSFATTLDFHPAQVEQRVDCVVGHLIAACTDGFVRIFPVPHHDNRKRIAENEKVCVPTSISPEGEPQNLYKLQPNGVLRLAPGKGEGNLTIRHFSFRIWEHFLSFSGCM